MTTSLEIGVEHFITASPYFREITFKLEIANTGEVEMDDKQATVTLNHHNHTKRIVELTYRHSSSGTPHTVTVSLCDVSSESVIKMELSSSDHWRIDNVSVSFWTSNSKLAG